MLALLPPRGMGSELPEAQLAAVSKAGHVWGGHCRSLAACGGLNACDMRPAWPAQAWTLLPGRLSHGREDGRLEATVVVQDVNLRHWGECADIPKSSLPSLSRPTLVSLLGTNAIHRKGIRHSSQRASFGDSSVLGQILAPTSYNTIL